MKYFLVVIITLVTITLQAQDYDATKLNKKAIDAYERALVKLRDGEIAGGIPLLKQAIEIEHTFAEAILSLGGAYGELKDYKAALIQYDKIRSVDSANFKYYELPYSINLAGVGRFDKALQAINRFLTIAELSDRSKKSGEYRKRCYQFGVQYANRNPAGDYVFAPINLGDSVNSSRSEYYPSITINDSLFVFTRRGEGFREDFFESNILGERKYSLSKAIDGDINMEPSKGAINISQDGEWLLFAGYNFRNGFGDFDLYISYYTPTGWSEPENLGPNINTEFWESSPSLSPDNRALYFSSNRQGGYGGKDLYVSYRGTNGKWSPAKKHGAKY